MTDPAFATDPCNQKFHLKCKIKIHNQYVQDANRSYVTKQVLLIPEESSQRQAFLGAWLPATQSEHYELLAFVKPPIDSSARLSIHRGPDKKSERHYLHCMSRGVSDIVINYGLEGKTIEVEILPETTADEFVDNMRDSDGSYDLIDGQKDFIGN